MEFGTSRLSRWVLRLRSIWKVRNSEICKMYIWLRVLGKITVCGVYEYRYDSNIFAYLTSTSSVWVSWNMKFSPHLWYVTCVTSSLSLTSLAPFLVPTALNYSSMYCRLFRLISGWFLRDKTTEFGGNKHRNASSGCVFQVVIHQLITTFWTD